MSKTRWRKLASHASCHHRRQRVPIFVPAWSSSTHTWSLVCTWTSIHRHRWVSICIRPARSTTSACRTDTGISRGVCCVHGIQWSAIIIASSAAVLTVGLLALHFERSKLRRTLGVVKLSGPAHWRWAVGSGELISKHTLLTKGLVVVCAVHVCVLSNTLFARFPADKSAAHSACHDTGCNDENRSRKHDPAAPFHVWHEQQDVDQESQKSDEQSWDGKDEESQEEARRVSGRVEMRSHGEREAY
jgi:hypothetical protein